METPVRAEKLMISALNNFRTPGDDFFAFFGHLTFKNNLFAFLGSIFLWFLLET